MNVDDLKQLFAFNYWARDKILEQADKLDSVEFHLPVESNYGSLQATMVHTLSAEWVWRVRCQENESPASLLAFEDFPSVTSLQSFWQDEQDKMQRYLAELRDDDLASTIYYTRISGPKRFNMLWHILWHVINHSTEHRSEAASILTAFGYSPGNLDFIYYQWDLSDR